ncbi:uncharacterized protein LOC131931512 [Physella acuta]|uniref:uncharacterized protein LOC131931512 n=1 Tax=Physella acuta TaxID=109671 RepID=UPI0027DC92B7|nr:uncharacterized protein LOC131931512 [Physella acuta]
MLRAIKGVPKFRLDVILIGKTGLGKSATGNSILDKENVFKDSCSFSSLTKFPKYDACDFLNYRIQVVDCPGVFDTDLDEEDGEMLVKVALQSAILINPEGYHAFIVVVKAGSRFTKEDEKSILILKHILGSDFLNSYGIIVFTHGDILSLEMEKNGQSLKEFCDSQTRAFKSLLDECHGRVVVFNNRNPDDKTKQEQRQNLVDMVVNLNTNNKRYTNKHFEKAQMLYKQMLDTKVLTTTKEDVNTQSCILDKISKAETMTTNENIIYLQMLFDEIINFESSLSKSAADGESPNILITNLKQARLCVEEMIKETEKAHLTGPKTTEVLEMLLNFQDIKQTFDKKYFSSFQSLVQENIDAFRSMLEFR